MQELNPSLQRVLLFCLCFFLIFLGYDILKYFIVPVLWASIITYMTWPLYKYIQRRCGEHRPALGAAMMLFLVMLMLGLPVIFAVFLLQQEGQNLYQDLHQQLVSGNFNVPHFIQTLPVIGPEVVRIVQDINANPENLTINLNAWIQSNLNYGKVVVGEISRNLITLGFVMMTLFFFYRDGQLILKQVSTALEKIIGPRVHHYLHTISDTTRAVVYGIGLTAVAQALLAGLSYYVAGVPNPTVLTIVTFLFALIPFGTPFVYGAVSLWLFLQGQSFEAIGVMAWGVCVVSTSDNVIRPMVISGATKIPFILIMFGVLGGVASFGFVGLFIGPVILAILLAIWREWLNQTELTPAQLETTTTDPEQQSPPNQ